MVQFSIDCVIGAGGVARTVGIFGVGSGRSKGQSAQHQMLGETSSERKRYREMV